MSSTDPLSVLTEAFVYLRDEWDGEAEEFCQVYNLYRQCRQAGVEFGPAFTFAMEELHRQCLNLDLDSDSDNHDQDDREPDECELSAVVSFLVP